MSNNREKETIKGLIDNQIKAVRNKDVDGATKNYAVDVILFDVVGPLQHKGAASVKKRLNEWFSTFKDNAIVGFETTELNIVADSEVAFTNGLNHVSVLLKNNNMLDMYWRETLNWTKVNGEWKIVCAHSSVPFNVNNGMASNSLKPGQEEIITSNN